MNNPERANGNSIIHWSAEPKLWGAESFGCNL